MQLRPAFAPVGRDARTRVTIKSIVYLTYLEIDPGNVKDPLPDGATIPLSRASAGVDLLQVVQLFDDQARRTLRSAIANVGLGLAGRGRELNQALADLPAATRNGTRQFQALTSHPGAIARSIAGAGAVARALGGERADDPRATIAASSAVFGAFAAQRAELGRAIDLLRPFEDRVVATAALADPVLDRTASLMRTLQPAVDKLAASLPDLNRALERSDVVRRETHRLTAYLRPILKTATPILAGLRDTVASVEPLLTALDSVVATIVPYSADISRSGRHLVSITSKRYAEGRTAPGNPALRFTPIFTRAACRDPYPEPDTAVDHSGTC
jgi:phospholipid/cholesterol/gamma-HCH transport system substrate-binding protein